tara:strand:+ start:1123 stop:1371 length:249 start_codon:yes stop_codon:yes gene_type:complete
MSERYLKTKEYYKNYYETNKIELLEKQRIYDQARKDKKAQYYQDNKAKHKAYYAANRLKILEYQKKRNESKKANELTSENEI